MESGDLSDVVFDVAAASEVFDLLRRLEGPLKHALHSFLQDLSLLISIYDRSWCLLFVI